MSTDDDPPETDKRNAYTEDGEHAANTEDSPTVNTDVETGFRAGLQAAMGNVGTWGSDRDTYDVFGWPEDPDRDDYLSLYLRNGYARVVVDKPADATWRDDPIVEDTADREETQFKRDVQAAARNLDLWSFAARADRVAGVVHHGLLLVGLSDVTEDLSNWEEDAREANVSGLDDVTTLKPILETQIEDIDWGGPGSERWDRPTEYTVDLSADTTTRTDDWDGTLDVHWTRAIDVPATRLFDGSTLARPRVEPVLNNLLDIEKTLGSAAEQSYRGADYGLHLNFDPEKVDPDTVSDSDLKDEFNRWYHNLQPEFKTVGAELNAIGGEMQDPSPIVETNLDEIAAVTGIPKRELRGNQQGEQAGAEQDEKSFFGMIAERRRQYATPHIARNILDRFVLLDLVADPAGGDYRVRWPDLTQLSELERSKIDANRASVIQAVPGLAGDTALAYLKDGPEAIDVEGELTLDANAWVDAADHDEGTRDVSGLPSIEAPADD